MAAIPELFTEEEAAVFTADFLGLSLSEARQVVAHAIEQHRVKTNKHYWHEGVPAEITRLMWNFRLPPDVDVVAASLKKYLQGLKKGKGRPVGSDTTEALTASMDNLLKAGTVKDVTAAARLAAIGEGRKGPQLQSRVTYLRDEYRARYGTQKKSG